MVKMTTEVARSSLLPADRAASWYEGWLRLVPGGRVGGFGAEVEGAEGGETRGGAWTMGAAPGGS
ncbi:hypothetical protein ACH427_28215 [Streptomyces sp. NPDC020379]|uniref:hypothetical protein n=1 Tax=Streptomyces sp. NPDC020379 TaxID=3365071 RepID=UPI0037873228